MSDSDDNISSNLSEFSEDFDDENEAESPRPVSPSPPTSERAVQLMALVSALFAVTKSEDFREGENSDDSDLLNRVQALLEPVPTPSRV